MGYKKESGLWIPEGQKLPKSTTKSWEDVLYSVKGSRLEEWDIGTTDNYKDNYTVYRAINLLAQNVAQVPLVVYDSNDRVIADHEVNRLLDRPNEDMSRFELWEKTMIYFYANGEAFWFLNIGNNNHIIEIHVLHPSYMKHLKDEKSGQIASWVFNDKIPMPKAQVIHFKLPDTKGLRGLSPIQTILREVAADHHAGKYNQNFFENFTQVGGYLKTDKDSQISIKDMKRVVNEWEQNHRGSERAYRIGALLGGMSYEETGSTHAEMEFLAGRKDIRDRVIVALGVNKTVLGIADDVNRSTARESLRQIWQLTLKPDLIRIQQKLDIDLFYNYYPGMHCKHDLSSVEELKKDFNETLESAHKLLRMGYTRTEINKRLNLDMPDTNDNEDLLPRALRRRDQEPEPIKEVTPKKEVTVKVDTKTKSPVIDQVLNKKLKKHFFEQRKNVLKIISESQNIFKDLDKLFDNEDLKIKKITDLPEVNQVVHNQIKLELFKGLGAKESTNEIMDTIKSIYNYTEKNVKNVIKETQHE